MIRYNIYVLILGHKNYFRDKSLNHSQHNKLLDFTIFSQPYKMAMISTVSKPDNNDLDNSLQVIFKNIIGLCAGFVSCESFFESYSSYILVLFPTNLNNSIDYDNFCAKDDFLLI